MTNADSYVSVADFIVFCTAFGYVLSDDAELDPALRRGTRFVDAVYRNRFPGSKLNGRDQALEWPRINVSDIDDDVVPVEIKNATCEAAFKEASNPGILVNPATSLPVKRKTVGPITTEWDTSGASVINEAFNMIDGILAPILEGGGDSDVITNTVLRS